MRVRKAITIICCLIIVCGIIQISPYAYSKNSNNEPIIVSLGDSYSSGEGIEPFYGENKDPKEEIKNDDWLAHRSTLAWSGQLIIPGLEVKASTLKNDDNNNIDISKNWFFVASSGAVTADLVGTEKDGKIVGQKKKFNKIVGRKEATKNDVSVFKENTTSISSQSEILDELNSQKVAGTVPVYETGSRYLAPQLDIFDSLKENDLQADYVTITIGGNDAGFADIVTEAAKGGVDFLLPNELSDNLNTTWKHFYEDYIDEKGDKHKSIFKSLNDAYTDIADKAGNDAYIIVAGYPKLIDANGFNIFHGNIFKKEYAELVNDSVTQFNNEIERLVNIRQNDGMNICFVSVEEKFNGHEAGSTDPFLNGIKFKQSQDLDDKAMISAYSMHPNEKGAKVYAECVQEAINNYEKEYGTKSQPVQTDSTTEQVRNKEREVVLVLDESGSMDSKIDKTREASNKFIDTMVKNDIKVAMVTYAGDSRISSAFSSDSQDLEKRIDRLDANGGTNIEAGLKTATSLLRTSDATKKIIVLMSDGEANTGKQGDELIKYANQIKELKNYNESIYIYTLGFFEDIDNISEAQRVMEGIASPGCHYEVDDPDGLVFFFGDIAEQINGEKNIYIRIACPVDVEVEYEGEKLTSKSDTAIRTSFGNITFEENPNSDTDYRSYVDDRIKVLRLKEGPDYNVKITGTADGIMNYSIKLANEYGEYIDSRDFNNIAINSQTLIDTIANDDNKTVLKVDNEGDGEYDLVYEAESNSKASLVEEDKKQIVRETKEKNHRLLYTIVTIVSVIILFIITLLIRNKIIRRRKALIEKYSDFINTN